MTQTHQFYHLIWKSPDYPSRLKEPDVQGALYDELHQLRVHGLLSVHKFFIEQHHLDCLISLRLRDPERLFARLHKALETAMMKNPPKAPLYFKVTGREAFDRFEASQKLSVSDLQFDPMPASHRLECRPLGESRRFVIREGNRIFWPSRQVRLVRPKMTLRKIA